MSKPIKISLASIILLLAIIFGILPGAIGYVAKNQLTKLGHSLKQRGIPFQLSQYQRHWFSSTARLSLANNPAIMVTIYHGPVIFHHGLTFATAKIYSNNTIENYDNKLKLLLAYNKSAELITTSQTLSPKEFLPQSIRTETYIPNVSKITSASTHVRLDQIQSSSPKSKVDNIDIHIDANKMQHQWHLTSSLALNGAHIDLPNNYGHFSVDQLEINNLSLQPKNIFLQVMQLQNRKKENLNYQEMAQNFLSSLITNKTIIEIRSLNLNSAHADNKINLTFNMHFSWPNLPAKPSAFDYLKFLKGHYDLSMPILNAKMSEEKQSIKLNNFNLSSNIDGFKNGHNSVHIDKLKLSSKSIKNLSLNNLDIKSKGFTASHNVHKVLATLELQKVCFDQACYNNSNAKLVLDNINEPNQSFSNLFSNISQLSATITALHDKLNRASASEQPTLEKKIAAMQEKLNNTHLYYYQFFINKHTQLLFNFKSTADTGDIVAKAAASWPQADSHSKEKWVTSPTINANIQVPTALIKKFANNSMKQINILAGNQCISTVGNVLSTKIHYSPDNIILNGHPLHECLFAKKDNRENTKQQTH